MRLSTITLSLLMTATAAHASSPDAWAALNLEVAEACAGASGLTQAHVSDLVQFDDTLGKVATLVTGIQPQASLKGATGTMLCIYDKAMKKAFVDEAEGWSAPGPR